MKLSRVVIKEVARMAVIFCTIEGQDKTYNGSISGHAKEAIILSSTESQEKYSYTLFWQVESKSPVSKFIIYLRKVGDSLWKNYEVDVDVPEFIADDDNNNYQKDTVNGRFQITGLEEASVYQVKIAAENVFGLSSPLNIFTFATNGAGTFSVVKATL